MIKAQQEEPNIGKTLKLEKNELGKARSAQTAEVLRVNELLNTFPIPDTSYEVALTLTGKKK